MIANQSLGVNVEKKETILYRKQMLHYGLYISKPDDKGGEIPWHWHDEFEIGFVEKGRMIYKTNHHEFVLNRGDGIFINTGVPHFLSPVEEFGKVNLHTHFFDKSFLAGAPGSLFDMEYIAPVEEQKLLDARPIYRDRESDRAFLARLGQAEELCLKEDRFFELRLRSLLSVMWETIYDWAMERGEREAFYNFQDDERIKKMLSFLQEHYEEKVSAEQLAKAAHISERECYRLFRKSLGTTPTEFLISLRLQKAQELLRGTEKSVLEIAQETGFGTSSYLCKLFKQKHHITPNQYRGYRKENGESRGSKKRQP